MLKILSKGMKFAPAPNNFDVPTITAEVESALNHQKVNQDTANNIRAKIVEVLNEPINIFFGNESIKGTV